MKKTVAAILSLSLSFVTPALAWETIGQPGCPACVLYGTSFGPVNGLWPCIDDAGRPFRVTAALNGANLANDYDALLWFYARPGHGGIGLPLSSFMCAQPGTPPAPPTPVSPPPLPPAPTVVNRAANSISFGQAGNAAGVGLSAANAATAQGDVPFDLQALCAAPSPRDGKPRSAAWINYCVASGK